MGNICNLDTKKRKNPEDFADEPSIPEGNFTRIVENKDEDEEKWKKIYMAKKFLDIPVTDNGIKVNTMYDAIFSCESLQEFYKNGWKYEIFDRFAKKFQRDDEFRKFCSICMLGETNKGKTFLANLLTNNKLKCGTEYKTVGLSCKFTNFSYSTDEFTEDGDQSDKKFLLFDSAGRSEPLLMEPEKKKLLKDEDLKRTVENNNRDLKLSEEFLKNLLIKNSKIILVVVNQLSLSEQLFLYELKKEDSYKELFVIHNLPNFKSKIEMENYINNTIINSIYFDISKDYYQIEDESENTVDKPYYFVEEQEKYGREKSIINHLILGDWETKDPWIKKFNDKTMDFLKTKMQICAAKDFFYVEKIIEKELQDENLIEEKSKINIEVNNIEPKSNKEMGILKIENKANIIQKNPVEAFVENDQFNLAGYTAEYIFYIDEKKSEFVIKVESAGLKDDDISIKGRTIKGKVFFAIRGKKKFPKLLQIQDEKKFKDKPFSIYFSVNIEKECIQIDTSDKINEIKPTYEDGVYRKAFPISKYEKTIKFPKLKKK